MERGPEVWSQDSSGNPGARRSRSHTELGRGRASSSADTGGRQWEGVQFNQQHRWATQTGWSL